MLQAAVHLTAREGSISRSALFFAFFPFATLRENHPVFCWG
jgi:hypothetical protein